MRSGKEKTKMSMDHNEFLFKANEVGLFVASVYPNRHRFIELHKLKGTDDLTFHGAPAGAILFTAGSDEEAHAWLLGFRQGKFRAATGGAE